MTPRIRMLCVLALVALLTIPVGVAFAGGRDGQETAAATGTSITQAPPTTAATTTEAPTTEAPTTTEAPPTTEAPATTAAPTTEAPTTTTPPTTAAPRPTLPPTTAAPVTTPPTTAPQYVRTYPTASAEEWQKAMAFAHLVKYQQDQEWAAAHPAPAPGEAPAAAPEPPAPTDDPLQSLSIADQQFLQCVRWRESRGDYGAVNPSSGAGGAYQMLQSTWNNTAAHLGRGDLIGLRPNWASVHDQDMIAVHLLQWYGRSPWAGPYC